MATLPDDPALLKRFLVEERQQRESLIARIREEAAAQIEQLQAERQVAQARAERAIELERIHVLEAEWAALTAPARLQRLAGKFMPLQPLLTTQVVAPHKLARLLPVRPTDDTSVIAADTGSPKLALVMSRLLTER